MLQQFRQTTSQMNRMFPTFYPKVEITCNVFWGMVEEQIQEITVAWSMTREEAISGLINDWMQGPERFDHVPNAIRIVHEDCKHGEVENEQSG